MPSTTGSASTRPGRSRSGNIDTIQNFVHLYDEHWFILVHVEIEAIAAEILSAIATIKRWLMDDNAADQRRPGAIDKAVWRQVRCCGASRSRWTQRSTTRRSGLTSASSRTWFTKALDQPPANFRGETGAQSSIMPTLVAFMKIPHRPSVLTDHLADMRRFMPAEHRALIEEVEAMPDIRSPLHKEAYNAVLEAIAVFRRVHYSWAEEYINRWTDDPRGTGGTPYMQWLRQMLDETEAHSL